MSEPRRRNVPDEMPSDDPRSDATRGGGVGELFDGLVLPVLSAAVFAVAIVGTADFQERARWFPLAVAVPGLLLSLLKGALEVRAFVATRRLARISDEPAADGYRREPAPSAKEPFAGGWLAWIASYSVVVALFGFLWITPVWVIVFSRFKSGVSWALAAIWGLSVTGVLYLITANTSMRLPSGILL